MATIEDVQRQAWQAARKVNNPLVATHAIPAKWLAMKTEGSLIGVPVDAAQDLEDGTVAQPFSSGAVLHWYGGDDVRVE